MGANKNEKGEDVMKKYNRAEEEISRLLNKKNKRGCYAVKLCGLRDLAEMRLLPGLASGSTRQRTLFCGEESIYPGWL